MKTLHVTQLYLNELNTYGDRGNLLALTARIAAHGYEPVVHHHHPGGELPEQVDVVLGGGGEDAAQSGVAADLQRQAGRLHAMVEQDVPMLLVCGSYQLFGRRYAPAVGAPVSGIGVFDAETTSEPPRMVGNVAVHSDPGELYGFENHGGRTHLAAGQPPLGRVVRGGGNNGVDGLEGARTRNAFGTYLHGPFLPLNPAFTDALIRMAAEHAHGEFLPRQLDDHLAEMARADAARRRY